MNQPYVKKYNSEGELLNPITKSNPYLHKFVSTRFSKQKTRKCNNRKPMSDRDVFSRLIIVQRIVKFIDEVKMKTNLVAFHRNN